MEQQPLQDSMKMLIEEKNRILRSCNFSATFLIDNFNGSATRICCRLFISPFVQTF